MAETDDPQNKPDNPPREKSSNRSRGRPWQNRSSRSSGSGEPRPAPEAPPTSSQDPVASGWKPLPATTGAGRRPPSADSDKPRSGGGQNRPLRDSAGEQNRSASSDRSRERLNRPPAENGADPTRAAQPNRSRDRQQRQPGDNPGDAPRSDQPNRSRGRQQRRPVENSADSNRSAQPDRSRDRQNRQPIQNSGQQAPARSQNRPPRQPDSAPATQQSGRPPVGGRTTDGSRTPEGRPQNQNRPRRRGPAQPGAASAEGSTARAEAQPDRGRRRQPGRRTSGAQPGSSRSTRERVDAGFHIPSVPIKARGGIRARTENGEFGKNWWAKRWLLAMERLMDGARLQRGRRYARMGQVLSMSEENNGIAAKVQGSRPQPYKVTIRISPLTDEQWDKVLDVLADQAIFTAQLLAGEMPADIEEAFSAAGVSLFPARGGDLITECSCPDWANPCKHIAATHYILGDRFDEDPFLILRMRGRGQETILQGLRQRRAGQEETPGEEPEPVEVVEPLDQELARFWEIGPGLESYSVNVQPSLLELPLLKRLGEPDFARHLPLERELGPAYEAISQAAIFLAFSDISREPPPENGAEAA